MKQYFLSFGLLLTVSLATVVFNSCGDDKDEPVQEQKDPDNSDDPDKPKDPSAYDVGVVINNVKWATRNVDVPGTFVAKPEEHGMFYQWNSKVGWSATDPLTPSDGTSTWNPNWKGNRASTWESTNNVCPTGWRIPTLEEQKSLLNSGSEQTTLNGVRGRIFGSGDNTIFLPATGYRNSDNGRLSDGSNFYWSSTPYMGDGESTAFFIMFRNDNDIYTDSDSRSFGFCVRCVAK